MNVFQPDLPTLSSLNLSPSMFQYHISYTENVSLFSYTMNSYSDDNWHENQYWNYHTLTGTQMKYTIPIKPQNSNQPIHAFDLFQKYATKEDLRIIILREKGNDSWIAKQMTYFINT